MTKPETKGVSVPAELYAKVSELVGRSGADSVDELVTRIVRDWVTKESSPKAKREPAVISEEDEKAVEERLKSLGYS